MTRELPWYRMYHEARTDAKLRSLADDEFRVWFNLLCYAAEQDERGTIDASDSFVLALEVANGDEELLSRAVTRLSRLRIVTERDNEIQFINFTERQYDKPSDAPEATRERKRKERERTSDSESVTPMSRDVTPSHALEESREEESRGDTEKRREERTPDFPAARVSAPAGFDEFYQEYPRKTARQDAEKAWRKLNPSPELVAEMMAALANQKTWPQWQQEGVIPHPATWINGKRWTDEKPITRASPNGSARLTAQQQKHRDLLALANGEPV